MDAATPSQGFATSPRPALKAGAKGSAECVRVSESQPKQNCVWAEPAAHSFDASPRAAALQSFGLFASATHRQLCNLGELTAAAAQDTA